MKKTDFMLRECVSKLPIEELRFLGQRLNERIGSDLAEATEALSHIPEIDKYLSMAQSGDQFFDMVDLITKQISKELEKHIPEIVVRN